MLAASPQAPAQCPPLAASGPSQPDAAQSRASGQPEFYDQAQFTVAGVTDTTNVGGHGSDTMLRTTEALTRETVSLKKESPAAAPSDLPTTTSEKSLREAVARDPTNSALHHSLAEAEEKLGNPLEAVREYQRAAELDPAEPSLFDWGAELLLHRALEPAIEVFTRGNRLYPRSTRMLVGLGVAAYARGSYDQAAQRLCQASDLDPADPNAYLFLGKMLIADAAQSQGTVDRLARFARLQPQNAQANYYYALSLWKRHKGPDQTGDLTQVESLLDKAVHLDPKLAAGYLQLGILYSDRGDFPRAISVFQQATAVSPELAETHYRLAQAYKRSGETTKAQQEIKLFEQTSTQTTQQAERERHEIQRFVYTLRDGTSTPH